MTNDTNTLNGALRELGETMAANLTQQGVTSTWDEGLTTLAAKILDITPGPTPGFDGIDLSSDKDILSAYDSESATLTAQLLNGSSPALVAGETVTFEVRKTSDDSLVETLTGTTNGSGVATVSYLGEGVGDLSIKAIVDSVIFSETYSLEDCILYDSLTSASGKWTIPSGVTSQYSSNGWRISANAYKQIKLTDKLTSECSVEFTISDYSTRSTASVIVYAYTNGETTPNMVILLGGVSSAAQRMVFDNVLDHDLIKGGKYRIEYTSSTIKVYENNTLIGQANNTIGLPTRFEWHMGADSRYAIYKDLKVKPL